MDDVLKQYIDRVLRLQQRRSALTLDQHDLEQIAREVGLTEADLAAVDAEVAAHRTRADGYLRHDLVDEALTELEHASALAPHNTDLLMEFANAHVRRWEEGDDAAGETARRLALRALDVDAGRDDAFALIARLREGVRRGTFSPAAQPAAIPIRIASPDYGVVVLPWKSTQTRSSPGSDKRYFAFSGWMRNDGDQELIELGGNLILTDVNGESHEVRAPYVLTIVTPPIRPGDTFAFDGTWGAPAADVTHGEFRIEHIEARPAARKYPHGPLVPITWACSQPPGVDISAEVRERSTFGGDPCAVLAVKNIGERAVTNLFLDLIDAERHQARVASGGGTPLFPGETRQLFVDLCSDDSLIRAAEVTQATAG